MKKINLNYFKVGEDFARQLENSKGNATVALRSQAQMLRSDADTLEKVANILEMATPTDKENIQLHGDTHHIVVKCPKSILTLLEKLRLIE